MPSDKLFPLSDVDGTVPGVAMLISADLSAGQDAQPQHATFIEDAEHPDPDLMARGLWESIKGDFPGHSMTVIVNERARYIKANRLTMQMIGSLAYDSPQAYWEDQG